MTAVAAERGIGEETVQYRLKDWGISRQRYWGTPIPVVYGQKDGRRPCQRTTCRSSCPRLWSSADAVIAARADAGVRQHHVPECGGPARRETDTMDTFVDSSWCFFRSAIRRTGICRRPRQGRDLGTCRLLERRRQAREPAPHLLALLSRACTQSRHDRDR